MPVSRLLAAAGADRSACVGTPVLRSRARNEMAVRSHFRPSTAACGWFKVTRRLHSVWRGRTEARARSGHHSSGTMALRTGPGGTTAASTARGVPAGAVAAKVRPSLLRFHSVQAVRRGYRGARAKMRADTGSDSPRCRSPLTDPRVIAGQGPRRGAVQCHRRGLRPGGPVAVAARRGPDSRSKHRWAGLQGCLFCWRKRRARRKLPLARPGARR